ncbi:MAG TPA: hypothetical protein VLE02_01015 [Nitrosarchaeum sp.]|nr:hypothetical protein [Nitrosarchaeum sp.]
MPLPDYTKDEYDRNMEVRFSQFNGIANRNALKKKNDCYDNCPIVFHSKNFCTFNVLDGSLTLTPTNSGFYVPPRINDVVVKKGGVSRIIKTGDLLCGTVDRNANGELEYSKWFICSEQFYRLWSLVCDDNYIPVRTEKQANKYKSGTKLATNAHLRWFLGIQQAGISYSTNEFKLKYYRSRVEAAAVKYTHLYSMFGLLLKYGEIPCKCNVPVTQGYYTLKEWHVPPGFCDLLIKKYCGVENLKSEKWAEIDQDEFDFPKLEWKPSSTFESMSLKLSPEMKVYYSKMMTLTEEIDSLDKIVKTNETYKEIQKQCKLLQKPYAGDEKDKIIEGIREHIIKLRHTDEYRGLQPILREQFAKSNERKRYFDIIVQSQKNVMIGKK